jgi:hypothetical protein
VLGRISEGVGVDLRNEEDIDVNNSKEIMNDDLWRRLNIFDDIYI